MITVNDPAGTGIAFKNAINSFTKHKCRLITTEIRYNFFFEKDIHVPDLKGDDFDEVVQLLKEADIIHFHLLADDSMALGTIKVREFIKGKKVIHHHHGHPHFRANPEFYRAKYKKLNRLILVSTPDLLHLIPQAIWQPNLVPVYNPLFMPGPCLTKNSVNIGQSPTRKDLKNCVELLEVITSLKKRLCDKVIEVDIIENMLYRECLRRKNMCHIIFDHMQGYFGVSSLESLSQGKPVIAGLDDWNILQIQKFAGTDKLPWIIARNSDELENRLEVLINDEEYRDEVGVESRKFMERNWSEQDVIVKLVDLYEKS